MGCHSHVVQQGLEYFPAVWHLIDMHAVVLDALGRHEQVCVRACACACACAYVRACIHACVHACEAGIWGVGGALDAHCFAIACA